MKRTISIILSLYILIGFTTTSQAEPNALVLSIASGACAGLAALDATGISEVTNIGDPEDRVAGATVLWVWQTIGNWDGPWKNQNPFYVNNSTSVGVNSGAVSFGAFITNYAGGWVWDVDIGAAVPFFWTRDDMGGFSCL